MRVIIAGGRDYVFTEDDVLYLIELAEENDFSEVVSGGARGADRCGEIWAEQVGLHVEQFPAEWKKYGKGAGHKRNALMAKYADAVVLFPGGKGTDNMFENARINNLRIFDRRHV
jgi:hypothetical protein